MNVPLTALLSTALLGSMAHADCGRVDPIQMGSKIRRLGELHFSIGSMLHFCTPSERGVPVSQSSLKYCQDELAQVSSSVEQLGSLSEDESACLYKVEEIAKFGSAMQVKYTRLSARASWAGRHEASRIYEKIVSDIEERIAPSRTHAGLSLITRYLDVNSQLGSALRVSVNSGRELVKQAGSVEKLNAEQISMAFSFLFEEINETSISAGGIDSVSNNLMNMNKVSIYKVHLGGLSSRLNGVSQIMFDLREDNLIRFILEGGPNGEMLNYRHKRSLLSLGSCEYDRESHTIQFVYSERGAKIPSVQSTHSRSTANQNQILDLLRKNSQAFYSAD